jgi:3-dehydroquinate synthase
LGAALDRKPKRKLFIVSTKKVFDLHGKSLLRGLKENAFVPVPVIIPDGECYKTLRTVNRIYTKLIENQAERSSAIVALGGGVVGDIAGFVAATFLRGIDLIQAPTTLLAQVDSSVGGKVGVNHALGKNLIGAFYQPKLVWVDTNTLETLPDREYKAGLYEVVKYGIIRDAEFFAALEEHRLRILTRDPEWLQVMIARCCAIKAEVVARDERESGLRMILNFGHTIGHALEAATQYRRFKHGEAVAWGMRAATRMAYQMKILPGTDGLRIEQLIRSIGAVPEINGISTPSLLSAMRRDKKVKDSALHFILPSRIGSVVVKHDVPMKLIRDVFTELQRKCTA